MTIDLASKIEAILFSEGGTLPRKKLAQVLNESEDAINVALVELKQRKEGSALSLIETEREVTLAVSEEASPVVAAAFERELGREVGDAGLEVLAIILYRGPSTRAEIDYIRGVNTSSTIRLLTARGLIERALNPKDSREYLYRPTVELLAHLGARNTTELPEYDKITSELAAFEESQKAMNNSLTEREPFEDHASTSEPLSP
ncbi:MAG: scpB [Candidatus Kaiserbacteria bacterium]|nr:scpB [Candidatus Kaiserbacteria bacterium]